MIDPDAPEPERRKYGLKRVDPLAQEAPGTPPPPVLSTQDAAKLAGSHHSAAERTAHENVNDPNDVFALRRELRAREKADDRDRIEIKPTKSRRKRDYWLLLTVLVVGFGGVLAYGIVHGNPVLMIYAFAGIVMGVIGLTWVMWFIMSDY